MVFLARWLHNRRLGVRGEDIAARYVKKRGLKVVERNWRENRSEIDIVAISKRRKELHIIEVKSRTCDDWGAVSSSLSSHKIGALRRGAMEFVRSNSRYSEYRVIFDVAVLFFEGENYKIEYIENIRF